MSGGAGHFGAGCWCARLHPETQKGRKEGSIALRRPVCWAVSAVLLFFIFPFRACLSFERRIPFHHQEGPRTPSYFVRVCANFCPPPLPAASPTPFSTRPLASARTAPYPAAVLAQNRFLADPALVGYLGYLQYWRRPAYAKFVSHPHALYFLELLRDPGFREQLRNPDFVERIHSNQYYHWLSYRFQRAREHEAVPLPPTGGADAETAPAPAEDGGGATQGDANGTTVVEEAKRQAEDDADNCGDASKHNGGNHDRIDFNDSAGSHGSGELP